MKTYQNPNTEIMLLAGERMMDEAQFSYGGGGHGGALMPEKTYAPQAPKTK
jgi:hypothetical protein